MSTSNLLTPELQKDLLEFTQNLVRIKSLSGQEEAAIKFIEKKIAVAPEVKKIIISEILANKSRGEALTVDSLKAYLHMVAAAHANVDIKGRKIESFSQFYRLAFYSSKKD